jgi:hypothetical protein
MCDIDDYISSYKREIARYESDKAISATIRMLLKEVGTLCTELANRGYTVSIANELGCCISSTHRLNLRAFKNQEL